MKHTRRALVVALLLYGIICLRNPDEYGLLDAIDLPIHETGHLVFAPFGEFLQFLGGTIFQLVAPSAFVIYFWRRQDRYAASVVLFWVAQNFWNIARYIGDARAQVLPLVGGGEHDWAYLLGALGWLRYDQALSGAARAIGFVIFALSTWFAWRYSAAPGDQYLVDDDPRRRPEPAIARESLPAANSSPTDRAKP